MKSETKEIRKTIKELAKARYSATNLAYHNHFHATGVIRCADKIAQHEKLSERQEILLQLAALYHDAIYIPGYNRNEEASAEAFRYDVKISYENITKDEVDIVCKLIKQTTISDHFISHNDLLLNILLDADLHSLSEDYDIFYKKQIDILKENGLNEDYLYLSVKFLTDLQKSKPTIYRTKYAIDNLEQIANANINRLKTENKTTLQVT